MVKERKGKQGVSRMFFGGGIEGCMWLEGEGEEG